MKYVFSTILALSLLPAIGFAQIPGVDNSDLNVELIPESPHPNEVVNVRLTDYSIDLDSSRIIWKINGVVKQSGTGNKTFSFTVGDLNSHTILTIDVSAASGQNLEKIVEVRPSSVDILWQSESFTPPFYRGKALFSYENKITFIAIPHISSGSGEIPTKNLIYKWEMNSNVIDDSSGYGKNTFTTIGSLIARPLEVTVEVSSLDGIFSGRGHIITTPVDPKLLLYQDDPIYGLQFQKALNNNLNLGGEEIEVMGIPFYFGIKDLSSPYISFKWSINGVPTDNDVSANTQVFRKKEGTSGTSNISLRVEDSQKILQAATSNFNLNFNNE